MHPARHNRRMESNGGLEFELRTVFPVIVQQGCEAQEEPVNQSEKILFTSSCTASHTQVKRSCQ